MVKSHLWAASFALELQLDRWTGYLMIHIDGVVDTRLTAALLLQLVLGGCKEDQHILTVGNKVAIIPIKLSQRQNFSSASCRGNPASAISLLCS